MSEKDLTALRFLIREREAGRMLRQTDLAFELKMTTASTSVLVDRLCRDGHLLRVPHPHDGRSVVLEITAEAHEKVKATLGGMRSGMLEATEALTEQERAGAAKFLQGLVRSVSDTGTYGRLSSN
nr:MarR family transcriptional regulator [Nesterenkonia sp. Act20]